MKKSKILWINSNSLKNGFIDSIMRIKSYKSRVNECF